MKKDTLEVISKYIVILLLIVVLLVLLYTAYSFNNKLYEIQTLFFHKLAGVFLLLLTLIHLYQKRKKFKKLTKEFLKLYNNEEITLDNNMDILISSVENKNLDEISEIFNMKKNTLENILRLNNITKYEKTQKLKSIAKRNNSKVFFIIVKIIEEKTKNK